MVKKIITFLLLLLIPLNVLACPHIDEGGTPHLQTYNEDYTEMTMIYPQDDYLYMKKVHIYLDGAFVNAVEDEVLSETYSFPVIQDFNGYLTYYWFLDEALIKGEELPEDTKFNIEGIDNLTVNGSNYSLLIHLPSSYQNGLKYENSKTEQVFYDVLVDNMSDEEVYTNLILDNNLQIVSDGIINISSRYTVVESENYVFTTEYKKITELFDEIEVSINAEIDSNNVVAVNLNKAINRDSLIEVTNIGNEYKFVVDEPGTYVVVEKTTELENSQGTVDPEIELNDAETTIEDYEEDNSYMLYILIGSGVLISSILVLLLVKKYNDLKKTC